MTLKVGDELRITLLARVDSIDEKGNVFVIPIGHQYRFMVRDGYVVQMPKVMQRAQDELQWDHLTQKGSTMADRDYGFDFDEHEDRRCPKCGKRMLLEMDDTYPVYAIPDPPYTYSWFCLNPEHDEFKEFAGHYRSKPEYIKRRERWEKLQDGS